MLLEQKQRYLDTFRTVLMIHGVCGLDVAGLQAKAWSLKSGVHQKGITEREKAAKWEKLAMMLEDKEWLMKNLAGEVAELQADEGLK